MPLRDINKLTFYGNVVSGNCLKLRFVADFLGLDYDWVEIDVVKGETQTEEFLGLNPVGKVPYARWPNGDALPESNAIILHLAETNEGGEKLIPQSAFEKAQMVSWMFWEQYSHEPAIAVRRYLKHLVNTPEDEIDPELLHKGRRALGVMELQLGNTEYLVGDKLSLADIALVAYTRWAHQGGFDLENFPAVRRWVSHVETDLGIEHAYGVA